jgi:hypothetical protein
MSLSVSDLRRFMAAVTTRLLLTLARSLVRVVEESDGVQVIQVNVLAGELLENIQNPQHYGFASRMRPGNEALLAFLAGDRSHGYAICDGDRRYRPQDLEEGEVALFTDEDTLDEEEEAPEWYETPEEGPAQGLFRDAWLRGRKRKIICQEFILQINGVESALPAEGGGTGLFEGIENMAKVGQDKITITVGDSAGVYYIERGP